MNADLEARVAILEAKTTGQAWSVVALALALSRAGALTVPAALNVFRGVAAFVAVDADEATTLPLHAVINRLAAFDTPRDPLRIIAAMALMMAAAGTARRDALRAWLDQATLSEIADDLRAQLDEFVAACSAGIPKAPGSS